MDSWKKALLLAMGLPSTIIGFFILLQSLVKTKIITQEIAQSILILIVVLILIKMIRVSWKKKR